MNYIRAIKAVETEVFKMGKTRYFRKRINRGIVLGVLLLVSVILFTVISNATFKSVERDRIIEMTEHYISDYTALLADHLGKPLGEALTEKETERIASDFATFADKYFVYKNKASAAGVSNNAKNMAEIEREYRDNLTAHIGRCQLLSMSLSSNKNWNGIEVKKAGPRNAVIAIDLTGVIKLSGDPTGLYFPGVYAYTQTVGEFFIDENGNLVPVTPPVPDDTVFDSTCTGSASLFLEKVNGEWKIAYVNYAYLNLNAADFEKGAYSK